MSILASIIYAGTSVSGTQVSGAVLIELRDAATGQLTNGNNITVTYDINLNGTITSGSVTIPGQSRQIYFGILSDSDPSHPFFTKFQITNIGTVPDEPPPVINQCDLELNFISIDKPESAAGALDAQVTINASSSYLPILYSKDFGATYQSSPTFTGLSAGIHEFRVKDANTLGCNAGGGVTIPLSTNLLIADPSVDLGNGNISRWSAAFNPVVFTYQRKDFEVTSIDNDPLTGKAVININAYVLATDSGSITLGDLVYLNAGTYKGVYSIISTYSNNSILIDAPYAGSAIGFININRLRPYYKIISNITYQDALTGRQQTIQSTNRPDSVGIVKADISNFLQSLLRAKDTSDFTQPNFRDDNLSASYTIQYAETWDTSHNDPAFVNIANPYYAVYAAKQLGQRYGGNLAAYVPFASINDEAQLAKWTTDFDEPAFSNGYPFDIGFIYSEHLLGLDIYCEITPLDINRNPLPGGPQDETLLNEDGSWLLNQDDSKLIITGATSSIVPIAEQLGLNRLLINNTFPPEAYYFNIALKYDDEHTTHIITQTQTIRIDDAVDEQSVYLRWIGLSGSWNYYRFVYNQEISLDVQNATIIKNYVSDWENQDGIEDVINKDAGQKMKVMAEDLSVNDIKGLQSIKYSPKVQMLINKNPVKWQTIVINTATYSEYETLNGQAPFSITFNMPSINIQTQ